MNNQRTYICEALPQLLLTSIYIFALWFGNSQFSILVLFIVIAWRLPVVKRMESATVIKVIGMIVFGSAMTIVLNLLGTSSIKNGRYEGLLSAVRLSGTLLLAFGLTASVNRRSSFCAISRFGLSTAIAYALIRPLSLVAVFRRRLMTLHQAYRLRGLPIANLKDKIVCLAMLTSASLNGLFTEALESIPALYSKGIREGVRSYPLNHQNITKKDILKIGCHFCALLAAYIISRSND